MAVGSNTLGLLFRIGVDAGSTQAQLKAVTDQLKTGVEGMKSSVSDLSSQFKVFGGFLEGLVAGGITGFIQGAIKAATATADWVNELDRASQATTIEIRTLAQLEGAFKEAGGSLNSMIGTFDIFAINLEKAREGNNKLIDVLEKYGITSSDITAATDQAFKALGSLTDQTEKARLAQELFGKGGARQILQFKELKDGIKGVTEEYKGLGDAIDPKLVAAARAYEAESKKLDAALVANRAVIAGIVLPAWVDFNISIRKAMESLTSYKSLVEHTNEALDKLKIGPGLPAQPERGLGGEVVTEAEARKATEDAIAARSLEAARKVKDEKIKIAHETTKGISDADKELADAQRDADKAVKEFNDILIESMEDLSKELQKSILDNRKYFENLKQQWLDYAQFVRKEIDQIIIDLARQSQPVPGGGTGIPGLPSEEEIQKGLDDAFKHYESFFQRLKDGIAGVAGDWRDKLNRAIEELPTHIVEAFTNAFESLLDTFIKTGHTGPAVMKQFVSQVLQSIALLAAQLAALAFGYALLMLAFQNYHDAALAAAAGVALTALAIGLGYASRAVAPSSASSSAGAGTGFGGAASEAPGTVTINQGAGTGLGIQLGQLHALNNISDKLDTASPGDVLVRGAEQNPVAIGQANNEAARRDGSVSREFLQISGLRTA